MRNSTLYKAFWIFILLASLSNCKEPVDGINSELLKGKWQFYEGFNDENPLVMQEPNDPALDLHFYGNDSVRYIGRTGKYSVDETAREIMMVFDNESVILEVLELNQDLLWTIRRYDNHVLEMHYTRIE